MSKLLTSLPSYRLLAPHHATPSDPSRGTAGNPSPIRVGLEFQAVLQVHRSGVKPYAATQGSTSQAGRISGSLSRASGVVVVADNDFTAKAVLYIGQYKLTSGEDFTPGVDTAATASALAALIDRLPGFAASVSGSSITVATTVPGPSGNTVPFKAWHASSVINFTLTPSDGFLSGGGPSVGPPVLL